MENRKHGYEDWGLVNESANNATTYPSPTPNSNVTQNSGYSQFDVLQKIVINLPKESQLLFNLQFSNSSNIPDLTNSMSIEIAPFASPNGSMT